VPLSPPHLFLSLSLSLSLRSRRPAAIAHGPISISSPNADRTIQSAGVQNVRSPGEPTVLSTPGDVVMITRVISRIFILHQHSTRSSDARTRVRWPRSPRPETIPRAPALQLGFLSKPSDVRARSGTIGLHSETRQSRSSGDRALAEGGLLSSPSARAINASEMRNPRQLRRAIAADICTNRLVTFLERPRGLGSRELNVDSCNGADKTAPRALVMITRVI